MADDDTDPMSTEVHANGFTFTCRTAGPDDGEPVLLLHGFPETSALWEPLMADLAGAGFRCVAPDQRGYSPGARPDDTAEYHYSRLAKDVAAIAAAVGFERYHIIGHDWGALAGWAVLDADPKPVKTWTAMSVPHYRAFATAVYDDPEQATYRGLLDFFESADAEEAFAANDLAALRSAWSASPPALQDEYAAVFSQPGALTGALNWYRANAAHKAALADMSAFGPVDTPTLLLWGKDDPYVRHMAVERAATHMAGPYTVVELPAGHWLMQEAYDEVRVAILTHLKSA